MNRVVIIAGSVVGVAALLWWASGPASSDGGPPRLTVQDAFVPEPPPGAPAAAYLELRNRGPSDDELVGASSPAADRVLVHRSTVEGGLATMSERRGIGIPAHGSAELAPGGSHLMLIGVSELAVGDRVPLRLRFGRADPIDVVAPVTERGAP